MSVKTAGVGHFAIPTAPAAGTSCTSGAANVFTTTYVQLIASTAAALYITGIFVEAAAALGGTYDVVQLATGGAGSETIVGQYLVNLSTGTTTATGYRPIFPPIPVANATRIACKTADSVGAKATLITLECIAQSNVVDDGIKVTAVGTVDTLTTYTGNTVQTGDSFARIGAAGAGLTNITLANDFSATMKTSLNAATPVASLSGDFSATMKTSLNASTPASITGAVGSVTAAITLPTIPANWIGAAGIAASALNGKGDWLLSSGYTAPLSAAGTRTALGMASANLDTQLAAVDADVLTRLATSGYTAPDNTSVAAIKTQTDKLVFTVAGKLDSNALSINGIPIIGDGAATPFHV
jgi:hypothetical protein